jgi:hypothetical protein
MGSGISKSAGAGISARPETRTFVFNADGYFRAKDKQEEVAARDLPKNSMDAFDSFNVKDPVSQDNHIPEGNGDLLFEDAEMAIEVCAVSRLLHSRILNIKPSDSCVSAVLRPPSLSEIHTRKGDEKDGRPSRSCCHGAGPE